MNFSPDEELKSLMDHIKSYEQQLYEYYKADIVFWQRKISELQISKSKLTEKLKTERTNMTKLSSKKEKMQKELAELQNDFRILNQHNQQLTKKLESLNNAKIKMKEIVTNTPIKTKVNKSDDFIITDSLLEGETEVSFTFTLEDDFIETAKTTVSYNNFTKIMKEFQQFKQKKQSKELTLERTENLFLPEYPELFKQFKDLITLL